MNSNKNDIRNEGDIKLMVDSFYKKVNQDALLGHIFNDVAKVNWDEHLPKMYSFWGTLILGNQTYKGQPLAAHIDLPIVSAHFERWIQIFDENMDSIFRGEVAEHTKLRAKSIAHVFQSKLNIKSDHNENS